MTRTYFQGSLADRMDYYTDKGIGGDCWLWTGTQDGKGYGLVWDGEKNCYAHVIAWERYTGQSATGRVVRHRVCDTPLCVYGPHLDIGTHADNVRDKHDRKREARGSRHGHTHLTEQNVLDIRQRYATGEGQVSLAYHFGTSQAAISLIVNRKTWTHV